MSLGGSKAVFKVSDLILITASFLKLYMFQGYLHCYFISKVEQSTKDNAECNFTVLWMEFLQFLVANVQSIIILIRVVRMSFSRQE